MRPAGRWRGLLASLRATVVSPDPGEACGDGRLIERAMRDAGLGAFLSDASHTASPIAVAVNDPDRDTDTRAAIEALMRIAAAEPVSPELRLVVAAGGHAFDPVTRRRHEEEILGPFRDQFAAIAWHDARDPASLRAAGPLRLHRWVAEGRFALGLGGMEPHYFAGCTGAHKTLTIGLMSLEDIERNHASAIGDAARPLALEGNPIFEDVGAAVRLLQRGGRRLFAVNQISCNDRLAGCTAGEPLAALREGLPLVRSIFTRTVRRPSDLIVACVDPPLDRTLYQADKGIKNVEASVRDGGMILLDAPCTGGLGPDRFLRLLERAADHAAAVALVRREGYTLGDHKGVRLRRLTDLRRVRLGIVAPDLPGEAARAMHAQLFADRSAAAAWAIRTLRPVRSGARPTALIVEDAGNMVLEPSAASRRRGGRRTNESS